MPANLEESWLLAPRARILGLSTLETLYGSTAVAELTSSRCTGIISHEPFKIPA